MQIEFFPVIGLEIHVQLNTFSKLFCPCSTDYIGSVPNTNICPVCLGLPGTLPVLNAKVVEYSVSAALALNCRINSATRFHRKNYFYPDLPKAYQISQYDLPVGEDGFIYIRTEGQDLKRIGIIRLHVEEDAGKLVHSAADGRLAGAKVSYVDYNRAGVPLAEIVSAPDLSTPSEAREYVSRLRQLVRYLGVSDGDMEKGSMRVDANISVKCSDGRWGDRTEIKNMNSLRALERALSFEITRQTSILADGGKVLQETRHWNDSEGRTISSRSKEEAHDYRYFPDPDLPPLFLPEGFVEQLEQALPEMPWVRESRFTRDYSLSETDVTVITESPDLADLFEECVRKGASPERSANWIRTEVLRIVNERKIAVRDLPLSSHKLAQILSMIDSGKLSNTAAKEVFEFILQTGADVEQALKSCNLVAGGLTGSQLVEVVRNVLEENASVVETIRSGEDRKGKKSKFLQGLVMRETRGQAAPEEVQRIIQELMENGPEEGC